LGWDSVRDNRDAGSNARSDERTAGRLGLDGMHGAFLSGRWRCRVTISPFVGGVIVPVTPGRSGRAVRTGEKIFL